MAQGSVPVLLRFGEGAGTGLDHRAEAVDDHGVGCSRSPVEQGEGAVPFVFDDEGLHEQGHEIRVAEDAAFSVSDERLKYNSRLEVQVNKAGVFFLDLVVPADYDVDALDAAGMSHWDDLEQAGERRIRLFLAQ